MDELNKIGVYACALPMPTPDEPKCEEWIAELTRAIPDVNEDVFLVGHSLGCAGILNYLETIDSTKKFGGVFLVSGPIEKLRIEDTTSKIRKMDSFFTHDFDFNKIKEKADRFVVIHGDDDDRVPFEHGERASKALGGELIAVPNGGHLNGKSGWHELPPILESLSGMLK